MKTTNRKKVIKTISLLLFLAAGIGIIVMMLMFIQHLNHKQQMFAHNQRIEQMQQKEKEAENAQAAQQEPEAGGKTEDQGKEPESKGEKNEGTVKTSVKGNTGAQKTSAPASGESQDLKKWIQLEKEFQEVANQLNQSKKVKGLSKEKAEELKARLEEAKEKLKSLDETTKKGENWKKGIEKKLEKFDHLIEDWSKKKSG